MILSRDEFLNVLNKRINGSDDESLTDIENLIETYDANKGFTQDDIDNAVEAKENEWRERYRSRFFDGTGSAMIYETVVDDHGTTTNENVTFDDIFTDKKED